MARRAAHSSPSRGILLVGLLTLAVLGACGRTALVPPDPSATQDADGWADGGSSDAGPPRDAGFDPDDAPWRTDTTVFDPARVDCLDLDAGLRCGLLTPLELQSVCRRGNGQYAELLATEALDVLVGDDATVARIDRDLHILDTYPQYYVIDYYLHLWYPLDVHFPPGGVEVALDGGNPGWTCLMTSLRGQIVLASPSYNYIRTSFGHDMERKHIFDLFVRSAGADPATSAWAHRRMPCETDICVTIDGSRFVYVMKTGDCAAPTYETVTIGVDGGVRSTPGWDRQRYPLCLSWFDQPVP